MGQRPEAEIRAKRLITPLNVRTVRGVSAVRETTRGKRRFYGTRTIRCWISHSINRAILSGEPSAHRSIDRSSETGPLK